jgi:hypothetical protein
MSARESVVTTEESPIRSPTVAEFAAYLEAHPATLPVWRGGMDRLYPILCALNVLPAQRQREASVELGDPQFAAMLYHHAHHNQVGIVVSWALRHLRSGDGRVDPHIEELERAFDLAGHYWSLANVMADVRAGVRGFESTKSRIRIPFLGNATFEATDRLLETLDDVLAIPEKPSTEFAALQAWERGAGRDRPWPHVPLDIREELKAFVRSITAKQETYFDPSLDLGGFTMGEAERVLVDIYARAWHSAMQVRLGSTQARVVLPLLERNSFVRELAVAARVDFERAGAIVNLLTVDLSICPDPCLTPLVPVDSRLAPMSSLITPGAMVRNFVARLQVDAARFGRAGQLLGLLGSRSVAATLRRRLTGALVTERVKVFYPDGRQAGDFDVVAYDPESGVAVVFEVVWKIGVDGAGEIAAIENRARQKRTQVLDLESAIAGGARPRWPADWSIESDPIYRWFILTPSVLPAQPDQDGQIPIRSHQILERFRWPGTTVADMAEAVLHPPPPPAELVDMEWRTAKYGCYEISLEQVRA